MGVLTISHSYITIQKWDKVLPMNGCQKKERGYYRRHMI